MTRSPKLLTTLLLPAALFAAVCLLGIAVGTAQEPPPVAAFDIQIAIGEDPPGVSGTPLPAAPSTTKKSKSTKSKTGATATAPANAKPVPPVETGPVETGPPKFALELKDGTKAVGVLDQMAALPLEVGFGKADVPLALIESVQFTADGKNTKVKFKNGDTLTGSVKLDQVKLNTAQGGMTVPVLAMAHWTAGGKFPPRGEDAGSTVATEPSSASGSTARPGRVIRALGGGLFRGDVPAFDGPVMIEALPALPR